MCGTKFEVPKETQPKKQMKFCMNCGKELLPGAAFCMGCGTPVGSVGKREPAVEHQRRQVLMGGGETGLLDRDRNMVVSGSQTRTAAAYPDRGSSPVSVQAAAQSIPSPNVPAAPDPGLPTESEPSGNSSIYIIEFLSALFKGHNIPVIIYLLMNVVFIAAICFLVYPDIRIAIPAGLIIYLISLTIALSGIGERLLRFVNHCYPLTDQAIIQRIMPIFNEAKRRASITARSEGRSIPDDIELCYNDEPGMSAFATGRKTICFSKGILSASDEMLLAAFEHEFGHIAHHDTDSILLITVGNLIFSAIITFFRIGIVVWDIICKVVGIFTGGVDGFFMIIMGSFTSFLTMIFIDLFMAIWTGIGNLLVLKSSRSQEYKADEFAFKCGKGRELQAMLTFLEGGNLGQSGFVLDIQALEITLDVGEGVVDVREVGGIRHHGIPVSGIPQYNETVLGLSSRRRGNFAAAVGTAALASSGTLTGTGTFTGAGAGSAALLAGRRLVAGRRNDVSFYLAAAAAT